MAFKIKRNINKPIELEVLKENAQLGNVPNVTTNNQTPTWTMASSLSNIVSGEKLTTIMGKISKAINDIISHIGNKNNPHNVTKSQLGLGNVENKSSTTIRNEINKLNITSALGYTPVTNEALDNKQNEIISRGEQLVINGNGFMGDNTNFSQLIFDGSQANGSPGSFTHLVDGKYEIIYSDKLFPVNPNLKYEFSCDFKSSVDNSMQFYTFLNMYDVDKKDIHANNHMYVKNTLTKLSKDLKPGDSYVYFLDMPNWDSDSYHRIMIWNYTNSFGYTYPANTYTRNIYDYVEIDIPNKRVKLRYNYSGKIVKAGTEVSQNTSGGTFKYNWSGKLSKNWKKCSGYYDGTDYTGRNDDTKFSPGTAYASVGILWNYNRIPNAQAWITNISVKAMPNESKNADNATTATSADSATKISDGGMSLYSQFNNEINFGGTTSSDTIYMGYRAVDKKPIPKNFIFGGSSGTATITAKEFNGNAKTATKASSADSVAWGNVSGKPTIPTKTSQLTNDSGYLTSEQTYSQREINNKLATKADAKIVDTRSDNQNPQWYFTNYAYKRAYEFKACSIIGLPLIATETYCTLETIVPWGDSSGGYPFQIARTKSNPIFVRYGTSATTWSEWQKIYSTEFKPTKTDVGLGNVDNTSDSQKSVKYATSAGSAKASDVYAWAKASTKPTYTAKEVGALPSSTTLANLSGDSTHRTVTDAEKTKWNNKSDFSGNYNDLTNKPTIPSGVVVVNNLTSTSTTSSLSANQGRVLNEKINNKIIISKTQPNNQNINDVWYEEL